jgi:glycine/D-amino acid oxidase-like deaminating enzyme
LLEAGRLAYGATGRSLGLILPQPDAPYGAVEAAAGRRPAKTAWKEAQRSARELASVLSTLPSRSDVTRSNLVINATSAADAATLRREQRLRKEAGLEAPWVPAQHVRRELGAESAGALRLRDAFEFDPVRAALALAAGAASKGARIFERSRVTRTKFTRNEATTVLATGTIRSTGIVVATGEPGTLFGQLRRHVRRLEGFAVVTHPLPASMRREVGARAGAMTEASPAPHWLRWLADDRAMFAGALSAPVPDRQRDKAIVQRTAQLMYELSVRYPAISGLPAAWGWSVPVISTPDGLPWIGPHRNYPFHYFALAMGWHGDSLAWFAARAAARYFREETRREDEVLGFARYL